MKLLTKKQFILLFLLGKGLTFPELNKLLKTSSSKGIYNLAKAKNKTLARESRKSKKYWKMAYLKKLNKDIVRLKAINKLRQICKIFPIKEIKSRYRTLYIDKMLTLAYSAYNLYKIEQIKAYRRNINLNN